LPALLYHALDSVHRKQIRCDGWAWMITFLMERLSI
jgi:hypothetical protein